MLQSKICFSIVAVLLQTDDLQNNQKRTPPCLLKLVRNPSQIANILDKLKLHEHHETEQYSKINKHIYIIGRSSYYIKSYRTIGTTVNNLKSLTDKHKPKKSGSTNQTTLRENKRLSRSPLPTYKKDKCIFCQLDKNDKLHTPETEK